VRRRHLFAPLSPAVRPPLLPVGFPHAAEEQFHQQTHQHAHGQTLEKSGRA
jgi:hypothetical protein